MSTVIYATGVSKTYPVVEERICGHSKKVYFRGIAPGIETALTVYETVHVKVAKWDYSSVEELEITCKCTSCGAKAFEILEFKFADNGDEIWETEIVADWCSYCETQSLLAESDSETEFYTPCPSPPTYQQAERTCDIQ